MTSALRDNLDVLLTAYEGLIGNPQARQTFLDAAVLACDVWAAPRCNDALAGGIRLGKLTRDGAGMNDK